MNLGKLRLWILFALPLAACFIAGHAHATPPTFDAACAQGTLTRDGIINEPDWDIVPWRVISSYDCVAAPCGNFSGQFKALWTPASLWIAVQVNDPGPYYANTGAPWNGSGVEIFFNTDDHITTTYDAKTFQWCVTYDSTSIVEYHNAAIKTVYAASVITPGTGYTMEIEIPWANLGIPVPAPGTYSGIDVAIDVSNAGKTARGGGVAWIYATGYDSNPTLWANQYYETCGTPTVSPTMTPVLPCSFNTCDNFITLDSANLIGPHEYQLTSANTWLQGEIWDQNRIDLTSNFEFDFQINLGANSGGADGIAFVLQEQGPTASGNAGFMMGAGGINPSIIVEFDTYANNLVDGDDKPTHEILADHIMVDVNSNFNFTNCPASIVYTATGTCPVQASASKTNIKDGNYHPVRIAWDSGAHKLEVDFDGTTRLVYSDDIVSILGSTCAYLGFTASTGNLDNDQRIKLWQCITSPTVSPTLTATTTLPFSPTITPTPPPTNTWTDTPTRTNTPTPVNTFTPTLRPTPRPSNTTTPLPFMLHVYPNSPNPIGEDGTYFTYYLGQAAMVKIIIYTVSGEVVRELSPVQAPRGNSEEFWDGKNSSGAPLASGVFLYRVEAVSLAGDSAKANSKCAVLR